MMVELVSKKKKVRCPKCEQFTSSVHNVRKHLQKKFDLK